MPKTKSITDGLFSVSLGGVNVYLIDAPEGLLLIDTGFPGQADAILAAIAALGRAPGDLRHFVLTHAHIDHIGSLAALVRRTGARTWMHRLDVPVAERGGGFRPLKPAPSLAMRLLYHAIYREGLSVEPARIDHAIEDGTTIPLAGGLSAIHVPGRCAGQVALLWPRQRVLFAADTCAHLVALSDPLGFENQDRGRESQRRLARLDFDIACFGHGRPIMRGAARRFRAKWIA